MIKFYFIVILPGCFAAHARGFSNDTRSRRSNGGNQDHHINVALETVLEFNKRDQKTDLELINNVQEFLDKVKYAITPSSRRTTTASRRTTTTTDRITSRETTSYKKEKKSYKDDTREEQYSNKKYQGRNEAENEDSLQVAIVNDDDNDVNINYSKDVSQERYNEKKQVEDVEKVKTSKDEKEEKKFKKQEAERLKNMEDIRFKKVEKRPKKKHKKDLKMSSENMVRERDHNSRGKHHKKNDALRVKEKHGNIKKKKHSPRSTDKLESVVSVREFFSNIAETLHSLSDDDLKTIIETADDEIQRFKCPSCNIEDDILLRRSMSKGIEVIRRTPLNTIRDFLRHITEYSQPETEVLSQLSGTVHRFFADIEDILANMKISTSEQMNTVMVDLKNFLRSSMSRFLGSPSMNRLRQNPYIHEGKKNLVDIVRNAIRTMIFDNYSNLDVQKKNWIKAKLKLLLRDHTNVKEIAREKPKFVLHSDITNKINSGFKQWLQLLFQGSLKTSNPIKQPGLENRDATKPIVEAETKTRPTTVSAMKQKRKKTHQFLETTTLKFINTVRDQIVDSGDENEEKVNNINTKLKKKEHKKKSEEVQESNDSTDVWTEPPNLKEDIKKLKLNQSKKSKIYDQARFEIDKNWKKKLKQEKKKREKDEIDKNWKLKLKREQKRKERDEIDKNWKEKLIRQQKRKEKDEIDQNWQEKQKLKEQRKGKKFLKQNELVHKIKPLKGKMKSSIQDYIDEIDQNQENIVEESGVESINSEDEDENKDDNEVSVKPEEEIQEKPPVPLTHKLKSQDEEMRRKAHKERKISSKNPRRRSNPSDRRISNENGISIEIKLKQRKQDMDAYRNTEVRSSTNFDNNYYSISKKNSPIKKVYSVPDKDHGKEERTSFKHETSNTNLNSELYIPKSRRKPQVKTNIDVVDTLDTNPIPPIQYEFSETGRNSKKNAKDLRAQSSSFSIEKNYLSTLFTTKGRYDYRTPISTTKTTDEAYMKGKFGYTTRSTTEKPGNSIVVELASGPEDNRPNQEPKNDIPRELIDKIAQVKQNFVTYQNILLNITKNGEITKASPKDVVPTETTARPPMPSTSNIFNRIVNVNNEDGNSNREKKANDYETKASVNKVDSTTASSSKAGKSNSSESQDVE